jgi:hypothetical protein
MVQVGPSAGCLRFLWDPDVPVGSCVDPCPKFGLINLSILNTSHIDRHYTVSHICTYQDQVSRRISATALKLYLTVHEEDIYIIRSSTMAEMQMESEEVLMARFEELSVLETEFEDVEIEISE